MSCTRTMVSGADACLDASAVYHLCLSKDSFFLRVRCCGLYKCENAFWIIQIDDAPALQRCSEIWQSFPLRRCLS